jgi:glucose/arabinose dehydrogenase
MLGLGTPLWTVVGLAGALLLGGCEAAKPAAPSTTVAPENQPAASAVMPYTPEVIAAGLNVPWELAFAPDGRIFFTERGGTLRVIEKGKLAAEPVFQFGDGLYKEAEAGVLGLALDPGFETNHYMYVYHTYQNNGKPTNRVVRLIEQGGKAKLDQVILDGLPGNRIHDGGRVKFGPDGMLYVTNGDAASPSLAQQVEQLAGKILRLQPDGKVPKDNPFPGSPVYSLGHRNPQGLAWHPVTKQLYSTEHGQTAHDELNRIEPGANYGWPLIEGDASQARPEDAGKLGPGKLQTPLIHSGEVTWAPSGITFVTKGPWKNNLLAANLRGTQLLRFVLSEDGKSVEKAEPLLKGQYGRIRAVAEGPDGSLYVLTNNRDGRGQPQADDDKLIRLKPNY